MTGRPPVAIAHDYLTQRGGAERVVLAIARAFPDATIHTSLYEPATTFPELAPTKVSVSALDRVGVLRRHHRAALPLLAPAMSRLAVDADVTVASSSGWAHGVAATGALVVYCHTPARWLYQPAVYLPGTRWRDRAGRAALAVLGPPLRRWDERAAARADRYLCNSTIVAERIRATYGIEPEVLPPPLAIDPSGPATPIAGIEPGYALCVSRLLPYKNVEVLIEAARRRPSLRIVVVGDGPLHRELASAAPANLSLLGTVPEPALRWLYAGAEVLVAPAFEDFGLTPVEAAAYGVPTVALRAGGYLDTVVEGATGLLFDDGTPEQVIAALDAATEHPWDPEVLRSHAERYSQERFATRLEAIVAELR